MDAQYIIQILGFLALFVNLLAVSRKNMQSFRLLHLSGSFLYIIYGFSISAMPIVLGAIFYACIHIFQLIKAD